MNQKATKADYVDLVRLIAAVNRAWHALQGDESQRVLAGALRDKKLGLQLELLRRYPRHVFLKRDDQDGHDLYSLRLKAPVRLASGAVLKDAMHAPMDHIQRYLPHLVSKQEEA